MKTGEFDGRLTDTGVVTAWDPADNIGAVTTDGAGHEVWIAWFVCAAGLRAADVAVGLRVRVQYEPVEDQDGFTWRAVTQAPVDATSAETEQAAAAALPGEEFSRLEIGPFN